MSLASRRPQLLRLPAYASSVCLSSSLSGSAVVLRSSPGPRPDLHLTPPATWLSEHPPALYRPDGVPGLLSQTRSLSFLSSSVMAAPSFCSLRPKTLWASLILLFLTSHPVFQEILLVLPSGFTSELTASHPLRGCYSGRLSSGLFQQLPDCLLPSNLAPPRVCS